MHIASAGQAELAPSDLLRRIRAVGPAILSAHFLNSAIEFIPRRLTPKSLREATPSVSLFEGLPLDTSLRRGRVDFRRPRQIQSPLGFLHHMCKDDRSSY